MKDVSKTYSSLPPKQATLVAWGLSNSPGAALKVMSCVPHRWRWCPDVEVSTMLTGIQSAAFFWVVLHLKMLVEHQRAVAAVCNAHDDADLIHAVADLKACESQLLANDAALDAFAADSGIESASIRGMAQVERFKPIAGDISLDGDLASELQACLSKLAFS